MQTILLMAHVAIAIGLVVLVLIQHGKGADAGAAFGSGASATVFGSQGSGNFLTRATAVLATLFFAASLTLAIMSANREQPKSVTEVVAPVSGETMSGESDLPADMPAVPQQDAPASDVPKL
ncbi:preprotein translocase subunit SecG [Solemya pervernicosa gill symbiont]|uniref:Protein-export membrane protein SecG n=2 Tax=Gammaproteobacteria incertae sedis TaxID=118884 RepID=A0A1T2L9W6_9GAMM|nr:preprotein translocase subunit SecG [Candidatus Reidiella endopervernicosa]OOZ41736.1 preprotein translocase subunit SecG [Solemya pervernicosa gill symbiont]QKQ26479.1 preprotein translocase subunit SecG [Candidatus Reidiella endopervernicosa]